MSIATNKLFKTLSPPEFRLASPNPLSPPLEMGERDRETDKEKEQNVLIY